MDSVLPASPKSSRWLIASAGILLFGLVAWLHRQFVTTTINFANQDFMSLWTGGRALLMGLNPYDEAVWTPLRAAYGSSWMPDSRAPFPLWTFIMTMPLALLPLPTAAAVWLTLQEMLLIASGSLLLNVLARRSVTGLEFALLFIVAFLARPTLTALFTGQMTFFLLFVIVLFLLLLERDRPLLAGAALSLLAMKPNPFIAFLPLVVLWLVWRRQWRVLWGGGLAGAALMSATNLLQPGWLLQWFNVRSKTEVVTQTPTLWGLAAELSGGWWAPVGFLLVILLMAAISYILFTRPAMTPVNVVCIALAASLLVTPYAWAYEHALLFLPWLWIFASGRSRRRAQVGWLFLAGLLPWLAFALAVARDSDSLGFIVPLVTLVATMVAVSRHSSHEAGSEHG